MCILHRAISDTRHATRDSYECVSLSLSLSFATHCIRLKSARVKYRNNTILHRKKEDHKSWLFDTHATREKDDSSVKLVVVVSKTRGGEKAPVDKRRVERYFFLWAFISRNVA